MRIKLDENLPASLADELDKLGHDTDTVPAQNLTGKPDLDIWSAAQNGARFLVTQELDFSDLRRFVPGTHHGLLLIRLSEPGRLALSNRLLNIFTSEDVGSWAQCFVVATDRKIRVRRPSGKESERG